MRLPLKGLALALSALLLAVVVPLLVLTDGQAAVEQASPVTPGDVDRAVAAMRQVSASLQQPGGGAQVLRIEARDLDVWVLYAVRQRFPTSRSRVELAEGRLTARLCHPLRIGRWINLDVGLRQQSGLPMIDHVRIGWLPLPPGAVLAVLRAFGPAAGLRLDDWPAPSEVVESVQLAADHVSLRHRLSPEAIARWREVLAPTASDAPRYRAYWERLVVLSRLSPPQALLLPFLPPMADLARERSALPGHDAAAENRAALLMLTLWATRRPVASVVSGAADWPAPGTVELRLNGRPDTALHFLVSAVISSQADAELSDAVGLWKELSDTGQGGSGFSFNDLAADRAGTLFGSLAVREPEAFQQALRTLREEGALMPSTLGLAEGLSADDLIAQYGGAQGEGTLRVRAEIDRRLAEMPLYRRARP